MNFSFDIPFAFFMKSRLEFPGVSHVAFQDVKQNCVVSCFRTDIYLIILEKYSGIVTVSY